MSAASSQRTIIAVPDAEFLSKEQLEVFAQLHQRDSHVVLVDPDPDDADDLLDDAWQLGHGGGELEFEARVEHVSAAITSAVARDHEVHLFGVGLGAALCVAAAAEQPKVRSLTTLAGWLTSDRLLREQLEFHRTLWDKSAELAQRHSSLLELSAQYRRNLGAFYDPTVPVVPLATARTMRRLSAAWHVDVTKQAGEVRCRTLVIAPTRDSKVPSEHSYELFAAIPDSTLLRIDTGHGALVERFSEVFSAHMQMVRGRISPGANVPTVKA